eukprot:1150543-Pelagomonas_calceolata.AAC.3
MPGLLLQHRAGPGPAAGAGGQALSDELLTESCSLRGYSVLQLKGRLADSSCGLAMEREGCVIDSPRKGSI